MLQENLDVLEQMTQLLLEQETINKPEVDMIMDGKSAREVSDYMTEKARERREAEEAKRREQEAEKRKKLLEEKTREGEKLVQGGLITPEEFENIKAKYQAELDVKVEKTQDSEEKLSNGVSLNEEEKANESSVQEEKETKVEKEGANEEEKPAPRKRKVTEKKDNDGEAK